MKKICYCFGFLRNLYFWLGLAQVFAGVAAGYGAYALAFRPSDDPLPLRIFGAVFLAVCCVGIILFEGIPHISRAFKANNEIIRIRRQNEEEEE